MSGDCDKCGEHCLDCKCNGFIPRKWMDTEEAKKIFPSSANMIEGNEIRISPSVPLKISINKEYFRKKFTEVIDKDYLILTNFCRKQLIEDLLACFDKKDDE